MLLRRLKLVNFRQHELTDLHFDRGLTGIVGPNGAGKTTLLEAIAFALYGVQGTRGVKETLRRRNAPPRSRFEVLLEFDLGARRYALSRTLTNAELKQDDQVIANSTGAVTERVIGLLGMRRDEFFNTYFTGQKELAVMAAMGRTERAQFLSRVMGFERLREAQDRLRAERSARKSQLTGIEQGLADPAALEVELTAAATALDTARTERAAALGREREANERMAALAPGWATASAKRTAWEALDAQRRLVEQRVAVARVQFQSIDQQLAAAVQAKARLVELGAVIVDWNALVAERIALDAAAAAYTARSQTAARRDQARGRLTEIGQQLTQLPVAARAQELVVARAGVLAAREATEKDVAERRKRWAEDVQEARTKREALLDQFKELTEQRNLIESKGPEGICPTCGRPLGDSFAGMLALLARQLDEVTTNGKYFGQRVTQLAELPAEIKDLDAERQRLDQELRRATEAQGQAQAQGRQRVELEAEQQRLVAEVARLEGELVGPAGSYDAARHAAVQARLAELDVARREHDQLTGIAVRAEALVAQAAVAEQNASKEDAALAALDERLVVLGWDATTHATMAAAVRDAELALQSAQFAVTSAAAALERAEESRAAAMARQADRTAKAALARALGDEINLLDELDRAFSDLRTELNLALRPDLQENASQLLSELTAGRYDDLELDESYVPTIVEDNEVKPVISGGEEDIVNLAMRLAISQMIAERAGKPLSLLVLDEIFGSLDEERRASVLALLRALSDRFPQVILITHVDGMRDAFDRLIRMSYDVERGVTSVWEVGQEALDVAV